MMTDERLDNWTELEFWQGRSDEPRHHRLACVRSSAKRVTRVGSGVTRVGHPVTPVGSGVTPVESGVTPVRDGATPTGQTPAGRGVTTTAGGEAS